VQRLIGHPAVGTAFRFILAGVLGVAGYIKMIEPHGARDAINAYRILPPAMAPYLGYALPALELVLAALLVVGLFVRISGLVSAILMVLFIIGIASVWIRGYSIDCGCFGGGGDIGPNGVAVKYATEIVRDIFLTLMGLWLFRWPHTLVSLERNNVGHTFTQDTPDI
jgi:uncharacterized membrane protein YphA (DoxX/SURF4 family)